MAVAAVLFCTAVLSGGQVSSRLFPKAVTSLGGLTLRVTLPQSHYGPGEAIQAFCTFTNTGKRAVCLPPEAPLTAVVAEGGKEWVFPQEPRCPGVAPASSSGFLAPGERLVRCLTVKPGRRDLLPGELPFRVYCVLAGKGVTAGTLVSEAVPLRIRYNVFWVN